MERTLASYNSHVGKASTDLTNARAQFDMINGQTLVDLHFTVGLRQLNQASNEMNGSYADLRNLYTMIYRNGTAQ